MIGYIVVGKYGVMFEVRNRRGLRFGGKAGGRMLRATVFPDIRTARAAITVTHESASIAQLAALEGMRVVRLDEQLGVPKRNE
jgi:hypothetical protein